MLNFDNYYFYFKIVKYFQWNHKFSSFEIYSLKMDSEDIITPKKNLEEKSRRRLFGIELRFEQYNEINN